MIPTSKEVKRYSTDNLLPACLRQAGEIHPVKSSSGEVNGHGDFYQIIRNKTVHLLSIFITLYIGAEVTIGGILFVNYMIVSLAQV